MIQHILVPLDGSETAERAVPHAVALAGLFDASIVLARVPEPTVVPVMSGAVWVTEEVESREATDRAQAYLDEVRARTLFAGLDVATATPPHPVAAGLLQAIEDADASLVVMTTHGYSGFKRWVFGSVTDKLIRAAHVGVYLIREGADERPPGAIRRLIVPLDGSELAESALATAAEIADRTGASITLAQVPTVPAYVTTIPETSGWIPGYLREQANEATLYLRAQASALAESGITSDIDVEVVRSGGVADGILASAEEHGVDLIVMSTHGRTGLGRWMFGSVADRVLRGAEIPVWLVRAPVEDRSD